MSFDFLSTIFGFHNDFMNFSYNTFTFVFEVINCFHTIIICFYGMYSSARAMIDHVVIHFFNLYQKTDENDGLFLFLSNGETKNKTKTIYPK